MVSLAAGIAALLGLIDLFSKPEERVLPWWGDAVVVVVAGIFYIVTRKVLGDDE